MKRYRCFYGCLDSKVVRNGFFRRQSDQRRILRLRCSCCGRSFSQASYDPCFRQRKRQLNALIGELLCSGVTQRRCALLLKVARSTVESKFVFVGKLAVQRFRSQMKTTQASEIQFDDLETSEHSKLKPVSVTLAVDAQSRKILALELSPMPAKGHNARISKQKYGLRRDGRPEALARLFESLRNTVDDEVSFRSDSNPLYLPALKSAFPHATYEQVLSRRACVVGQGELKKIGFDPPFSLNHTCAMLRANLSRLVRRTWCTTKKMERLKLHLFLYANFHNEVLIQ